MLRLQTNNLLSEPLKRAKFGQFSISFYCHFLWNKIFTKKIHICNFEFHALIKYTLKEVIFSLNDVTTQLKFICSKSKIETSEKDAKYIQS